MSGQFHSSEGDSRGREIVTHYVYIYMRAAVWCVCSINVSICPYVCMYTNVCTNVCRGREIVTHYMRTANGHTLDVYNYIVQRLE